MSARQGKVQTEIAPFLFLVLDLGWRQNLCSIGSGSNTSQPGSNTAVPRRATAVNVADAAKSKDHAAKQRPMSTFSQVFGRQL